MKRHQMRYYPRMREIEVNRYIRAGDQDRPFSAPRIDWSWAQASELFHGKLNEPGPPQTSKPTRSYAWAWLLLHVAVPHVVTFLIATLLFGLGHFGYLSGFELGAASVPAVKTQTKG